jgi:mono/diheme cytochrome c family protein
MPLVRQRDSGHFSTMLLRSLLLLALATTLQAQDSTAASSVLAVSKGVYSAAQADRGEKVFQKVCVECHELGEFMESLFDKEWLGKTLFDFFDLVKTTMPDDKPGTLASEDVLDVIGYIFKLNAYPAGSADLPADPEKMKQIQIDARPAPSAAHSPNAKRSR